MKLLRSGFVSGLFLAVFLGFHVSANAAILTLSGTFNADFSAVPDVSGSWTAQFDTAAMQSQTNGPVTASSGIVAPSSFSMTPLQVQSGFEFFATFAAADVRVEAGLLNDRLSTVRLAGFRDGSINCCSGIGDFDISFGQGSTALPPTGQYFFYNSGAGPQITTNLSGTFTESWTDSVSVTGGELLSFFGGAQLGGLEMLFSSDYTGDVVIVPNPEPAAYQSPNFFLALGNSTQFWDITPTEPFVGPVELVFGYDRDTLEIAENDLAIFHFSSTTQLWEELNTFVDPNSQTVRAYTTEFSVFTLGQGQAVSTVPTPNTLSLLLLTLPLMAARSLIR